MWYESGKNCTCSDIILLHIHLQWQGARRGQECSLFTSQNGTFKDGSGLSNYKDNFNCTWMIAASGSFFISISFTELSTQLNKDFVRVFQCSDVACSQQQLLAELSGVYTTPQDVTSSTGYMKVVFTSDSSVNYDGFTASWAMVKSFAINLNWQNGMSIGSIRITVEKFNHLTVSLHVLI
jgi:hypothetical protein